MHQRLKADFIIKEKYPDNKFLIIKGTARYTRGSGKIIYSVTFPEKQVWVQTDTFFYIVKNGKGQKQKEQNDVNSSVYAMALQGGFTELKYDRTHFEIIKTEKEKDMVLTRIAPKKGYRGSMSSVLFSFEKKRLKGIAIFRSKTEVVYKEIISTYSEEGGVLFPAEIIRYSYSGKKEKIKITQFKNILTDEKGNDSIYNFSVR